MKVGFKNFILLVQGCILGSTGVDTDHEFSNYLINSDPSVIKGIREVMVSYSQLTNHPSYLTTWT